MQADASGDVSLASKRRRALARVAALRNERSSWISHWREISEYQQPRAGRFVSSDRNRGDKKHNHIVDSTAIRASRILAAGMMSGMTSPARPWFALELDDRDMMEHAPVKHWLHDTARVLRSIFAASNTYRTLHTMYTELGLFGTAANVVVDDFENVIHNHPLTIGEYCLATNPSGTVNTLTREFQMTVAQMIDEFGEENCSQAVRDLYRRQAYDQWMDVVHVIQPRRGRDSSKRDAKNMPWESLYFEPGSAPGEDKFLRESGFKRFPVLAPRWEVVSNDTYGHSPGMECLGDVKQLQHQQTRKGQAIDYMVNPPLVVPTAYKEATSSRLPGGVMFVDNPGGGNNAVRSAFDVNLNLQHLLEDINDVRERVRGAYYADMFLMLANGDTGTMTATEVAERHEEKLLMLGPVLERLHNELLSPLIDLTFDRALAAGILLPAPPEMQGMELKVNFISVLAQAQRAVAAQGVDRLLGAVGQLATIKPEIVDKVDFDQVVDDYAEMYGVNPKIIVPDDAVATLREQRAQQMAAQQAAAAAPVAADTAKTMGETNVQGVQDVMNGLMGYNTPAAATY